MKRLLSFIKNTVMGAIWFLIPLVVLVVVFKKAHEIAGAVIRPIANLFPFQTLFGVAFSRVLAVMAIVLFCFFAALLSKTPLAHKFIDWLEETLLSHVPGYDFVKSVFQNVGGMDVPDQKNVVMARIEDAWQIGFITEVLDNGLYAVFIPGAPIPWSGDLFFMTEDRFQRINISSRVAIKSISRSGRGSQKMLADFLKKG